MGPLLRASPRHGGVRRFNTYSLKSPRGRPVGGGDVHRVREYESIIPHIYNLPNTCVTHSNNEHAFSTLGKLRRTKDKIFFYPCPGAIRYAPVPIAQMMSG
jgi:hypothetical protein